MANSIISWIAVLLSIPLVENSILNPPDDELPRDIIHEYSETAAFQQIFTDAQCRHRNSNRSGDIVVLALADYVDKHGVFKGSKEAYMFSILNMKRRLRNLSFMQFLIAEMSGNTADLLNVRHAILPELHALYDGIPMYVASFHKVVWVYAILEAQIADTQVSSILRIFFKKIVTNSYIHRNNIGMSPVLLQVVMSLDNHVLFAWLHVRTLP